MDLPFELSALTDEASLERGGGVKRQKKATFYLGKFGPFVERFSADEFSDDALRARADALRRTIENAHR